MSPLLFLKSSLVLSSVDVWMRDQRPCGAAPCCTCTEVHHHQRLAAASCKCMCSQQELKKLCSGSQREDPVQGHISAPARVAKRGSARTSSTVAALRVGRNSTPHKNTNADTETDALNPMSIFPLQEHHILPADVQQKVRCECQTALIHTSNEIVGTQQDGDVFGVVKNQTSRY